jgi:hypothetical protein
VLNSYTYALVVDGGGDDVDREWHRLNLQEAESEIAVSHGHAYGN